MTFRMAVWASFFLPDRTSNFANASFTVWRSVADIRRNAAIQVCGSALVLLGRLPKLFGDAIVSACSGVMRAQPRLLGEIRVRLHFVSSYGRGYLRKLTVSRPRRAKNLISLVRSMVSRASTTFRDN
jgi:hypothetical protein